MATQESKRKTILDRNIAVLPMKEKRGAERAKVNKNT